ncbi:MAG: hypothetical protein ACRDL5_10280 [Solirubrobacteraceae bacterium]
MAVVGCALVVGLALTFGIGDVLIALAFLWFLARSGRDAFRHRRQHQ